MHRVLSQQSCLSHLGSPVLFHFLLESFQPVLLASNPLEHLSVEMLLTEGSVNEYGCTPNCKELFLSVLLYLVLETLRSWRAFDSTIYWLLVSPRRCLHRRLSHLQGCLLCHICSLAHWISALQMSSILLLAFIQMSLLRTMMLF